MVDGRGWNRVFWLGFPAILGLLWIQQHVRSIATELLAYLAILIWILYCIETLSRSTPSNALLNTFARIYISMAFAGTPSNALLNTFARIYISMAFAGLVALGLIGAVNAGPPGYAVALSVWLALFLAVRAIVPRVCTAREGMSRSERQ